MNLDSRKAYTIAAVVIGALLIAGIVAGIVGFEHLVRIIGQQD